MSKTKIAVLQGDGIGKEVMPEALKVVEALGKNFGYEFEFNEALMGLGAYLKTGNPLPDETLEKCKESDAVFKGPVGDERDHQGPAGMVEKTIITLRTALDLYANLRPCRIYPGFEYLSPVKDERIKGTDIMFARENVSGLYPNRGKFEPGEIADFGQDMAIYSRRDVHRIAKVAYELAKQRRKKVTIVAKKNILASSRAFDLYAREIAKDYPDIQTDYQHVDAMAMYMISKPAEFDVILTTNMFGDILSDLGGGVMGSLGFAWSVNIGEKNVMCECTGGSAPDIEGENKANPIAMILSAAEVFRYTLKDPKPSDFAHKINEKILQDGWRTGDIKTFDTPAEKILGTKEMGDKFLEYIKKS